MLWCSSPPLLCLVFFVSGNLRQVIIYIYRVCLCCKCGTQPNMIWEQTQEEVCPIFDRLADCEPRDRWHWQSAQMTSNTLPERSRLFWKKVWGASKLVVEIFPLPRTNVTVSASICRGLSGHSSLRNRHPPSPPLISASIHHIWRLSRKRGAQTTEQILHVLLFFDPAELCVYFYHWSLSIKF